MKLKRTYARREIGHHFLLSVFDGSCKADEFFSVTREHNLKSHIPNELLLASNPQVGKHHESTISTMTAETLIMPKTVADLTETVVKLLSRVSSRPCEESTENCIENSVSPGQESPEASENDSVVEANVDENDDWEILSAEQEGMPPTDQDKLDAPAEDVIEKNHGPSVEKTNATDKNEPPTAAKGHMTRLYSSVVSDREVSKQPAQTLKQSR